MAPDFETAMRNLADALEELDRSCLTRDAWQWLHDFMHDTLNPDFLGDYQREQVGPIPDEIVRMFDLDHADMTEWFTEADDA